MARGRLEPDSGCVVFGVHSGVLEVFEHPAVPGTEGFDYVVSDSVAFDSAVAVLDCVADSVALDSVALDSVALDSVALHSVADAVADAVVFGCTSFASVADSAAPAAPAASPRRTTPYTWQAFPEASCFLAPRACWRARPGRGANIPPATARAPHGAGRVRPGFRARAHTPPQVAPRAPRARGFSRAPRPIAAPTCRSTTPRAPGTAQTPSGWARRPRPRAGACRATTCRPRGKTSPGAGFWAEHDRPFL